MQDGSRLARMGRHIMRLARREPALLGAAAVALHCRKEEESSELQ